MWMDGAICQPNCTDMVCSHGLHVLHQGLSQHRGLCSGCPCAGTVTCIWTMLTPMPVRTSKWMLQKLQVVQNNAARLVCLLSKCSHFSPVLKHLHWLPVWQEIKYKLACLADKALNCVDALACLVLKWQQTSRRLQSSGWHPVVPSAKNHLETGHLTWLPHGCGTVCQALMWLPQKAVEQFAGEGSACGTLNSFERHLKTFLCCEPWQNFKNMHAWCESWLV